MISQKQENEPAQRTEADNQPRPEVIAGLRNLFQSGATYSGLLRYLLQQHANTGMPSLLIQRYIMEAFSVPFHCPARKDVTAESNDDYYATIDTWLIARVISQQATWLGENASQQPWWANLPLTARVLSPTQKPAWMSDASWAALLPSEQEKLSAATASCVVLSEEVLLLARLAEQLQRRWSDAESASS